MTSEALITAITSVPSARPSSCAASTVIEATSRVPFASSTTLAVASPCVIPVTRALIWLRALRFMAAAYPRRTVIKLEGMTSAAENSTLTSIISDSTAAEDPTCEVAHGHAPAPETGRALVAVFFSPVARFLLAYGQDAGFRPVLAEPDPEQAEAARQAGFEPLAALPAGSGWDADVVVTDHHRPELGLVLQQALASGARWVGVMGNPRHPAPHIPALAGLGVPDPEIARVHRPIGLNIGSRNPAEIAIATLAGLIADRNGRPGGFSFPVPAAG